MQGKAALARIVRVEEVVVDDLGRLHGIVAPLDILRPIRDGKTIIAPNGGLEVDYVDLRKLGGAH